MTQTVERPRVEERAVERRPPAPRPPALVRWIPLLVASLIVVAGVVGLILSLEPDDTSFEVAEQMRFERIGANPIELPSAAITAEGLAALEDQVGFPATTPGMTVEEFAALEDRVGVMSGFDMAETARFNRIAGMGTAITVEDLAALEGQVGFPTISGFDMAETARFYRIAGTGTAITVEDLAALEDQVGFPTISGFDIAETARFNRIAEQATS